MFKTGIFFTKYPSTSSKMGKNSKKIYGWCVEMEKKRRKRIKEREVKERILNLYFSRFVVSPYLGNLEHFSGISFEKGGRKYLGEAWKVGRFSGICVGKGGEEPLNQEKKKKKNCKEDICMTRERENI